MARKPDPPSLFPDDPDNNTEPLNQSPPESEGAPHAVPDHRSRTPATTAGDARPAKKPAEAANDNGAIRARAEDQPRSVEGNARSGESGQRPEPDRVRGAGDGHQGPGGSFAARITSERRNTLHRRSNGVHPQSHVARLKASRKQPTLFD